MDDAKFQDIRQAPATSAMEDEEGLMITSASFEIDTSGVERDLAELAEAIDGALTVYGDQLVTPEAADAMGHAELRRRELAISRAIRRADEMRRQLNRDYKIPLDLAKKRYDELMGPVIELHAAYKQRRIALEEAEKERKKDDIRAFYESHAPGIALPGASGGPAPVPFERIFERFGAKWLNKGEGVEGIGFEILGIVQGLQAGERRIDEAGLAHPTEAKAVYWQTFDVEAAFARDRELCAFEARRQALASGEPAAGTGDAGTPSPLDAIPDAPAERPASPDAAPDASPATPDAEAGRLPRVMIIDGATDEECRKIGEFCRSLGISGVFKGPRFHEAVQGLL